MIQAAGRIARRDVLRRAGAGITALPLAALGAAGCQSGRPPLVDFAEGPRNFLASDYESVFSRWTRHARLVSANEGNIIEAWATLKSWEFREAYLERYAQAYALSPDDRSSLWQSELAKLRGVYDFHLTVQTTDFQWNDLHERDSPWRVILVDGTGDELHPDEINRLRLPVPYEQVFFPHRTAFTKAYAVRFARPAGDDTARFGGEATGELTLRITGPLGRVEMAWHAR
ncbi:MAG: hypothetical protein KA712_18335 [Myxococcales bacterium]|nr:hypothetical protein [Myxococcales bacterium]